MKTYDLELMLKIPVEFENKLCSISNKIIIEWISNQERNKLYCLIAEHIKIPLWNSITEPIYQIKNQIRQYEKL